MAATTTPGETLREIALRIRTPGVCGHCGQDVEDGHLGERLGETTMICRDCCSCGK